MENETKKPKVEVKQQEVSELTVKIVMKSWKYKVDDEKRPTIAGEFQFMRGDKLVTKQEFNQGFNDVKIVFPSEIMVQIEALNHVIEKAIVNTFLA
jgi:hypothetical protein